MTDQDKEYLRDLMAMFAMNGLIAKTIMTGLDTDVVAKEAYEVADSMLEARKPQETIGLPAIKRKAKAK